MKLFSVFKAPFTNSEDQYQFSRYVSPVIIVLKEICIGQPLDGWSDVLSTTINEVGWGSVDNLLGLSNLPLQRLGTSFID